MTTSPGGGKFKSVLLGTLTLILAAALIAEGTLIVEFAHAHPGLWFRGITSAVTSTATAISPSRPSAATVAPDKWAAATPPASGQTEAATPLANIDAWKQLRQFNARLDQLFAGGFTQPNWGALTNPADVTLNVPKMDLKDEQDHYVVQMDIPGANKGTIKVNVEGPYLTVSAQRETNTETQEAGHMISSERSTAAFERTITLPGSVRDGSVTADYSDGVLTITLPKSDTSINSTSVTVR